MSLTASKIASPPLEAEPLSAHEAKNAVACLLSCAHLLRAHLAGDDEALELLDIVLQAAERTRRYVDGTLERCRTGRFRVLPGGVRSEHHTGAGEVAERTVSRLRRVFADRVELQCRCAPHPLPVGLPAGDLEEILLNLVKNAIEACRAAGRAAAVSIAVERCGPAARIAVRDNGPGFLPGEVEALWQPYATERAGGSGIGLAMVRETILAHGGSIDCVSSPGVGSEFILHLPLVDPD